MALVIEILKFLVFLAASLIVVASAFTFLPQRQHKFIAAGVGAALVLAIYSATAHVPLWLIKLLWLILVLKVVVFTVPSLRKSLLIAPTLRYFRRVLPEMSTTEREALEAGTVWWEGEIFSGRPNWQKLMDAKAPRLTEEEQAFLNGPVDQLCAMIDDWQITAEDFDLPPHAWDFIREQGFFGMIIPKQYGGLGFSAYAHSEVVMKISSRSTTAGTTVMVPNSLGPGLLLLEYGTQEQRDHYLPRLAKGVDIPCFALTGPEAGSDAAGMPDNGVICRGQFEGQDIIGIRLNWNKRYITLAPVATVMGVAFKLFDPEHLLGEQEQLGITLALIPTTTAGVDIGARHLPANAMFMNGPIRGKDVFIPLDWIIGGQERAGQGWRMLMECLSDGRGISLPSLATAAGKFSSLHTGAYARIREQFNIPIGEFEGIQERLAEIAGNAYLMDAVRSVTAATVDMGERPSVASAIAKYQLTERMRLVINHAMDIHGGAGICMGPNNRIGRVYQELPIGITVEGANILTRSLIIFGQGSVRCHPWILKEMQAAANPDSNQALEDFDDALCQHASMTLSNVGKSFWGGIHKSLAADAPADTPARGHYLQVSQLCAPFALIADLMMLRYGGALKRLEAYSALLSDMLCALYMASASLKHFRNRGALETERELLDWAMLECRNLFHRSMFELLDNRPFGIFTWIIGRIIYPLGRPAISRNHRLDTKVARVIMQKSPPRDGLIQGIYLPTGERDPLARMERAFPIVLAAAAAEKKYKKLRRKLKADDADFEGCMAEVERNSLLSKEDIALIRAAYRARLEVIQVDHFPAEYFKCHAEAVKAATAPNPGDAGGLNS